MAKKNKKKNEKKKSRITKRFKNSIKKPNELIAAVRKFVTKNKKYILYVVGAVIFISGIAALLIISPQITLSSLSKPKIISEVPTRSGDTTFAISTNSKYGVAVKYKGNTYFSNGDDIRIPNIKEGKGEFKIYTMRNFYLFKLISDGSRTINVDFDHTPPEIDLETELTDEFYDNETKVTFTTSESWIEVFVSVDDKEETVYSDKEDYSDNETEDSSTETAGEETLEDQPQIKHCTVREIEDDSRKFECYIPFEEEGKHKVSFLIKDDVGNELWLAENKTVSFIEPVSLNCPDLPSLTNEIYANFKCTPNKDGTLFLEQEEIQLTKDNEIEFRMNLGEEGENVVKLNLEDKDGREFSQTFVITRDTTIPLLNVKDLPLEINWKRSFTIEISSDEKVSGYVKIEATQGLCSLWKTYGYEKYEFTLNKDEKFTKSIYTGNYKECFVDEPSTCYSADGIWIDIFIKDEVGNERSFFHGMAFNCLDCPEWW